jgi:O-methyltransferase
MTSPERMHSLWAAVRHVCRLGIAGDVVECGVWRGGSWMVVGLTLEREGDEDRRLWRYDTFEGMNEPTSRDVAFDGLSALQHWEEIKNTPRNRILANASLEDVRRNTQSTRIAADRVKYVVGPVEETLPATAPERIALLCVRRPTGPSQHGTSLSVCGSAWSPAGCLSSMTTAIGWVRAKASTSSLEGRPDAPLLVRVDYTGRVAVKR